MMDAPPLENAGILAAARALAPPKRQNKHAPKVTAQHQLFAMLNGEAVTLSEAEWRTIPGVIRAHHLRRIKIRTERFVYGVKSDPHSIKAVMGYLIHCRWAAPAATCTPTQPGRGGIAREAGE